MTQSEMPIAPPVSPPVQLGQPLPAMPRKGWWGRNWKWFVPVGCLGAILLFAGFIVLILAIVFGAIRSSDIYKEAVAEASANAQVAQALGTPIEPGWLVVGRFNVRNDSGSADLTIPISGPRGRAVIYVVATKTAGKWKFTTLLVTVKGSDKQIDLKAEHGPI